MGRRRRRKEPSIEEVVFILLGVGAMLLVLNGVSFATIAGYALWVLAAIIVVGFAIWFIKGQYESTKPKAHKSGKSSLNISGTEKDTPPKEWTTQLIADLDWRVFEKLCIKLWEEKGFSAKETGAGADGGVDFYLYADSTDQKIGAVQCKSWSSQQIGVKVFRELQGVVASEELKLGLLMYSGTLSKAASEFLTNSAVTVKSQDGTRILAEIYKLPEERQAALLSEITSGDYASPSCPKCDVKLVRRTARKSGKEFWGCANFPRCRYVRG